MWVPGSVDDVNAAIADGLQESPWLDAKRELGKAAEAAKDVAAMANEGGVLLYGVEEDHEGALSGMVPMPDLHRFEERVANAVRDGVHNPPDLSIRTYECEPGSDAGIAVVVVPRSPLAPHLVDTKREGRFYGRTASTTSRLTGAQIEMLLQRRRATTTDHDAALEAARDWRRRPPRSGGDLGGVTVMVTLSVPAADAVARAAAKAASSGAAAYLGQLFEPYRDGDRPLSSQFLADAGQRGRWQIGADLFLASSEYTEGYPPANVEAEVGRDGRITVRSRGAVTTGPWPGRPLRDEKRAWCDEWLIASTVAVTLHAAGRLLEDASQLQQVTCSVHVERLEGASSTILATARSHRVIDPWDLATMVEGTYQRHLDVSSRRLVDAPTEVAAQLLGHLFEALAQGEYPGGHDPLALYR